MPTRSRRISEDSASSVPLRKGTVPNVRVRKVHREKDVRREKDEREHSRRRHRRREISGRGIREKEEAVYVYKSTKDRAKRPTPAVRRSTMDVTSSRTREQRLREKPGRRESEREPPQMRDRRSHEVHKTKEPMREASHSKYRNVIPPRSEKRSGSGSQTKSSRNRPTVMR